MSKLLIATTNPGKFAEIKHFLKDLPLEIINCRDAPWCVSTPRDEPIENGKTFTENAIIKAKFYFEKTGLPVIADDGGIEIDFFHGEPGVLSKRWIGGKETSDQELIAYTLEKMRGLPKAERGAQLHTVVSLALPNGKILTEDGIIRGIIAEKVSDHVTPGFPYRALFLLPEINKYYDPSILTKKEYEKYGHRGKAIKKLIPYIKKYIL